MMQRAVPADAIVVGEKCTPGCWLGGYRRVAEPRKLAYPVGWGALGFGFPASIGLRSPAHTARCASRVMGASCSPAENCQPLRTITFP